MFTKCVAVAVFALTLGTLSAEAAERGTLKNTTDRVITYQVGYANPQGYVSWQTYRLNPGQYHTFTVQDPKTRPLHMQWDEISRDGKVTFARSILPTKPNGYITGFFMYGNQIRLNTSGAVK